MLRNSIEIIQNLCFGNKLWRRRCHRQRFISSPWFFCFCILKFNYRLYTLRNLIHFFLLSVYFLTKENIEGNLTHVLFQVDNDTEVDVYRARGLHGKIYDVSNCMLTRQIKIKTLGWVFLSCCFFFVNMADERLFELFITFLISVKFLFNSWTPHLEWNRSFDPGSFVFNSKAAGDSKMNKWIYIKKINKQNNLFIGSMN